MTDTTLPVPLPCPFCGNDKNITVQNELHDHSGGYFISCPECMASTGLRFACGEDPRPLLLEQWNARACMAPLQEELEKVNNEFGSQTASWPDAWKRVADLKDRYRAEQRRADALEAALKRLVEKATALEALALPKFNWAASALDANAIKALNEFPLALHSARSLINPEGNHD